MKIAGKTDILTRADSTIVFTNSVFFIFCVSFKFCSFAENAINIGVSAKNKKQKNNKLFKLKIGPGPSMLRNIIGPVFNLQKCVFFGCFLLVFKNPLLSAGRMNFLKIKKQKNKKNFDQFLTYKSANLGPAFNFTTYIYIYGNIWQLYIYNVYVHVFMYMYVFMYVCTYVLWSYYQVQVWPFQGYCLVQVGVITWSRFVFLPISIVVSSVFCTVSYHFVFCCAHLSGNFLKRAFFQKLSPFFSNFSVSSLIFENSHFLRLLKHYKNRGFSKIVYFCWTFKEKKNKIKVITGISGFGFLVPKWPFVTVICLPKMCLLKPLFL